MNMKVHGVNFYDISEVAECSDGLSARVSVKCKYVASTFCTDDLDAALNVFPNGSRTILVYVRPLEKSGSKSDWLKEFAPFLTSSRFILSEATE